MGLVRKSQEVLMPPNEKEKPTVWGFYLKKQKKNKAAFYIWSERVSSWEEKNCPKECSLVQSRAGGPVRRVLGGWPQSFPYSPPDAPQLPGQPPEPSGGQRAGPPAHGRAPCTVVVHGRSPGLQWPVGVTEDNYSWGQWGPHSAPQ